MDFIRAKVAEDLELGKFGGGVVTRFPPEPNGYLHIGHAKAAYISFGIASENNGAFHLRYDDTNPAKEREEFVRSQEEDLRWLGIDWGKNIFFTSDYFEQLYDFAVQLIQMGKAYVCDLSPNEIKEYRGTLTTVGKESPYRLRTPAENLTLFERMRAGDFDEGSKVLRARIDMSSGNLNMRDPVLYRILNATHYRTQDSWHIYPTYDFAHGQSDSIEGVTHSLCTTEYEDHRPLYDWLLDTLGIYRPQQIEFARLKMSYTVMSKRVLNELVRRQYVFGWDDPRMPTVSGMRRRGYPTDAVKRFCDEISVAKRNITTDVAFLEHCVRDTLNKKSPRVMAVLRPLMVVIDNYPDDMVEELDAINNPEDASMGSRKIPFSKNIFVERDDFSENPHRKFFRLAVGMEVRLRYGYFITCTRVVKDEETGEIIQLHCTYDPKTKGGQAPDGRKVRGTIHWVSASHSLDAEIRLYDHLFTVEDPGIDCMSHINPTSLVTLLNCQVEPSLHGTEGGTRYQFERQGYYCVDSVDSTVDSLVFNRTVSLRDTWAKIEKR